jgi:hypothetical protein
MNGGAVKGSHDSEELPMQMITTIGLDIAKSVFQVHGVDAAGEVIIRRQLKRRSVLALRSCGLSTNGAIGRPLTPAFATSALLYRERFELSYNATNLGSR